MSKTIDELVQKVQLLNEKVTENQAKLTGLDIDYSSLHEAANQCEELKALAEEADGLRAQLSEIVGHTNQLMASIKEEFQRTKKVIKLNFESEHWSQFGVQDKR